MTNKHDIFDRSYRDASIHQSELHKIDSSIQTANNRLEKNILETEELLANLGITHTKEERPSSPKDSIDTSKLIDSSTIDHAKNTLTAIESEFSVLTKLDKTDTIIALSCGGIAALIDFFLVQTPKHPGFLGASESEGGWLSNLVKDKFDQVLSDEKIKDLENAYKVCYDPSVSTRLDQKVAGLGPRTHRFQSLGHDPILGFIFGTRDILNNSFTAIDKYGQIIIQKRATIDSAPIEITTSILQAFKTVAGHLLSDVNTPAGLPAPIMPLLLFIQTGKIGSNEYSIGEIARIMYRSGYDLRHFIAGGIPVLITELIIRFAWVFRRLSDSTNKKDAIPNAKHPRLRRQLLLAHSVASAANAGKIYLNQNPLSLNWAQWLALGRYLLPEFLYLLNGGNQKQWEIRFAKEMNKRHRITIDELDSIIKDI